MFVTFGRDDIQRTRLRRLTSQPDVVPSRRDVLLHVDRQAVCRCCSGCQHGASQGDASLPPPSQGPPGRQRNDMYEHLLYTGQFSAGKESSACEDATGLDQTSREVLGGGDQLDQGGQARLPPVVACHGWALLSRAGIRKLSG